MTDADPPPTPAVAAPQKTKAHCPKCDGERSCLKHGETYKPWDYEDREGNSASGGVTHSLLECCGCETVFYETASWNSEDVDHYYDRDGQLASDLVEEKSTFPKPEVKTRPEWFVSLTTVDRQLHAIMTEMYVAYDSGSYILTAVGLRTALDRATEALDIDPAITFAEKLAELQAGGWIGDTERDILEVITDTGNAAAHRGYAIEQHEAAHLINAMEVFLQRAFIVGKKALNIRGNIPAKPKRRAQGADLK